MEQKITVILFFTDMWLYCLEKREDNIYKYFHKTDKISQYLTLGVLLVRC